MPRSPSKRRNAANVANASTATGTIVTAESGQRPGVGLPYVGRFAPSPTGQLHLGSLVAALGSYLDARHYGGRWLVRLEDLDTPRVVPGCADTILRTLEAFGLTWDGEVVYQSQRTQAYREAASVLSARGYSFECSCSRRMRLENEERGYPGTCRDKPPVAGPTATRFRIDDDLVFIEDRFQGHCELRAREMGDVVIRRRDGIYAYQLAVVVDDAAQGITQVVRGADLLSSTAWQVCLQKALNVMTPGYGHLPLVTEPDGSKLSKSRRSIALDPLRVAPLLFEALVLLQQPPDPGLEFESVDTVLQWGVKHWNPGAFHGIRTVAALPSHANFSLVEKNA